MEFGLFRSHDISTLWNKEMNKSFDKKETQ